MFYLKSESSFDAAHFLKGYEGKCSNIHGHRWRVVVEIKGDKLSEETQTRGMLVDFSDLKKIVKELCDKFDHTLIYEEGSLKEATVKALLDEDFRLNAVPFRPTAENFSKFFYDSVEASGFDVNRVSVYETPNNCACYEG
ncbi:6-pyruvoyltetrahydropterin/6-carboxytetrahydropterin synthase [Oribacterium sp. KHPX15]|uniref:6-carboxytetrahydropterin synthase QueD n=1 Tax=unclassified Oribacterium TaxID=2629782 RepID=UPI0004E16724|nr:MULTISPECIES: 6-carboxytetrahydropterin synthase QueD [unclassified Oribacterium]SDZ99741.1 6-pyruvoyltetrahydropterin/6-carboxytetrahydropterin synthase [Oribacterium sp. KHPX15]